LLLNLCLWFFMKENIMRTLVIGGGGREHALCWAMAQSPNCAALFCAPGNPGIAAAATCVDLSPHDHAAVLGFCQQEAIDFIVIGPEDFLVAGLADTLRGVGLAVFGPSQAAAQLEGSKGFMKDVCAAAGVPTARYRRFTDQQAALDYIAAEGAPIVVKTDGLAAGKGVVVAQTVDEAQQAVRDAMQDGKFGAAGAALVIEECMVGEEVSFFALCDGTRALPFASAQDHKTAYAGDRGPNTGGMGAYSPAHVLTPALTEQVMREIVMPTITSMAAAGTPYCGILFCGLMLTATGPRLIEYNVRFGDPETQAMLPRLQSDLLQVLYAAASGRLDQIALQWRERAALCVVLAAAGYPATYQKGTVIKGLEHAAALPDTLVFHAGTARSAAGDIVAAGGRVLGITGLGVDIAAAQRAAYAAVDQIIWPEGFCRRDIGWRAVGR
jgi:phosphoribosylamine---glycine ligase